MDSITDSMDMSLSKLRDIVKDREAWLTAVRGVAKSQTQLNPSRAYHCRESSFLYWQLNDIER